jgi:hypothetical protein
MPKDLAGNNFLNARTIAVGSPIKDFVNKFDRIDVYKVSLGQRSSFSLSVASLKANVSVSLYGSNGQLVQSSNQPKKKPEQISSTLEEVLITFRSISLEKERPPMYYKPLRLQQSRSHQRLAPALHQRLVPLRHLHPIL